MMIRNLFYYENIYVRFLNLKKQEKEDVVQKIKSIVHGASFRGVEGVFGWGGEK